MTEPSLRSGPHGTTMCWIRINEKVLQRNLLNAGQQMTSEEIHAWLKGEGWELGKDGLWLVDYPSLELLDPSEYEIAERPA